MDTRTQELIEKLSTIDPDENDGETYWEAKAEAANAFLFSGHDPEVNGLHEACYTVSEMELMFDGSYIDADGAIKIWKMVENLRKNGGFPKELVM